MACSRLVRVSALSFVLGCADEGGVVDGNDPSEGPAPGDSSSSAAGSSSSGIDPDSTGADTPLLDDYPLAGDMLFPEGVAFDAQTRAFYVGSLEGGSVQRIDADGTQIVFAEADGGSGAGIKVDAARRQLWLCDTSVDGAASIQLYLLDDPLLTMSFELATLIEGAGCNDLALDAAGRAYVTDPPSGAIHRITDDGTGELWATDPLLAPELGALGVNGIAVTPDDTAVVVAKYSPPALLRIAIHDPTDIAAIVLEGDDFGGASPLAGADGIVFLGDILYVVFDDVVKQVELSADGSSGQVTTVTVPGIDGGLSTATVAEGRLYVVKSEVRAQVLGTTPELPFRIVHVPLP